MRAFSRVRVERYEYGRGFAPGIAPHAHDDWQVCYSPNGGGHIRAGGRWIEARPGVVYAVAPHVEHSAARDAVVERPAEYFVVYISAELAAEGASSGGGDRGEGSTGCAVLNGARASELVRAIVATDDGDVGGAMVEDGAVGLLGLLGPAKARGLADVVLARRAREMLMADPVRCASLAELSAEVQATPHRVRAAFKSAYGVPPVRYHMLQRLQKARALLRLGVAADSAARRTGFVDQAHLTNRLRRYFGHTPGGIVRA